MKRLFAIIAVIAALMIAPQTAAAYELTGWIEAEGRYFFNEPLYSEQERHGLSVAGQAEFFHELTGGLTFTLTPFYRWDSVDDERTHFDLREALLIWPSEKFELRVGVTKVFWGVTESRHLVDVINQTDLVESINEEEKLGQPMVNLTLLTKVGVWDFFVLPYFRERTFPGEKGRLRLEQVIDSDRATYENSEKERHVDFAVRYGNTFGDADIGISHFYGTGREPSLNAVRAAPFDPFDPKFVFAPHYELINQTGLDLQYVYDAWLLKLEAIYRSGQASGDFYATVAGFEYTVPGLDIGGAEISLLAEHLFDDREQNLGTSYDNDYFFAVRIALNDVAGSELLAGYLQDAETSSASMVVEASRRIGDRFKAEFEAYLFLNPDSGDIAYFLRDDDFAQFTLKYFF